MVYVTHDQVEAMTLADKIVVLDAGIVQQVGKPIDLYQRPSNLFVAGFIGSPKMNLIEGAEAAKHNAQTIGIRPEHIQVSNTEGLWEGSVGVAEHLGSDTFIHIHGIAGCDPMTVRAAGDVTFKHGDKIYLTPDATQIHKFDTEGLRID